VLVYIGQTLYLKLDNHLLQLKSNQLSYGLDLLLKTYLVFHANYPEEIDYFFQFLEIVSQVKENDQVRSIIELEQILISMNV
jgi:hypothetical protein